MVVETDWVNVNKKEASPRYLYLGNEKGNLRGLQTNFEKFFDKYLSQFDTCQLESA